MDEFAEVEYEKMYSLCYWMDEGDLCVWRLYWQVLKILKDIEAQLEIKYMADHWF